MFFEPPPAEEPAKRPPMPPWAGPPEAELGAVVPVRALLASGGGVFIALADCVAFSNGFELGISVRSREDLNHEVMGFGRPAPPGQSLPDDLLRLGVQFVDGRKGTTLGNRAERFRAYHDAVQAGREPELPTEIVMWPRGGGGGGRRWDHRYWVWPLPPEGPVQVVCEWPAKGIALTMHPIDGAAIRAAAAQSTKLWEDDDQPGSSGWSTGFVRRP